MTNVVCLYAEDEIIEFMESNLGDFDNYFLMQEHQSPDGDYNCQRISSYVEFYDDGSSYWGSASTDYDFYLDTDLPISVIYISQSNQNTLGVENEGTFDLFDEDFEDFAEVIGELISDSPLEFEPIIEEITGSWNINNKTVKKLQIGNKIIQTITRVSDGVIIYQKPPHDYLLTAQLSLNTIYTDGSTVISGILTDNGSAMANESIIFYDGNTEVGSAITNSNGAYSKTLSGFRSGTHTLKASHTKIDSPNVTLTVNAHTYNLTAILSDNPIYTNGSTTISGNLTQENTGIVGVNIHIYDGNTFLGFVQTTTNGAYSFNISGLSVGTHSIKAVSSFIDSSSISLVVTAPTKIDTQIMLLAKRMLLLKDENNNPLSNKTLHTTLEEEDEGTILNVDLTTNSNGTVMSPNNHYIFISAVFDGDDEYNSCSFP